METQEEIELTPERLALDESLLAACRALDPVKVKSCLDKDCDTWFQDIENGFGPLHCVVAAAAQDMPLGLSILDLLLGNGAIWNQCSHDGETPGCLARRIHSAESPIYDAILQAGVRAELLLAALDKKSSIRDGERNETYLSGKVEYMHPTESSATLLDQEKNAIMMSWEAEIMRKSAEIVVPHVGRGSVLNIGFGLGLIDTAIQERRPARHVIVEAHPDVLAEMKRTGWYDMAGVEVIEGRWQDVVDSLADRETFDGIYYDPFEYWEDMRQFFDAVVALLNPEGVFSFFHGLGADNQTFYDVYTRILEIELSDFGLTTSFEEMAIHTKDEEWKGTKRRYWNLANYRLPTCKFMQ